MTVRAVANRSLKPWGSKKPKPFLDTKGLPLSGSISEKLYVSINGVDQGMFIKGRDLTAPVLLYLHGGMPDYFLTQDYPTGLDDYFVVAWWEQRGSGLSYSRAIPSGSMTTEQIIADTIEVAKYLCERFDRDKVFLMGHSGGTFIGIQAAAKAPDVFRAYVAVAQMSFQLESERLAHQYMMQRFDRAGNAKMVRRLARAAVTDSVPLPKRYMSVRDVAMHRLGIGTMRDMRSIVIGLLLRSFRNREYTLREKIRMWRGKRFSKRYFWNTQLSTDLTKLVPRLEIPVYFLHGRFDYTVSYSLARSYLEELAAPLKGFYTFDESAHSPLFEEPDRLRTVLTQDVLTGSNRLAETNQP